MSGRDFKSFLTNCRPSGFDTSSCSGTDLVRRFIGGQKRSSKYRNADYEQMKDLSSQYKQSGLQSLKHVTELSKANKKLKELSLLRQHSDVWIKESYIINTSKKATQTELEAIRATLLHGGDDNMKKFFHDVLTLETQLVLDQETFHTNTVKPVLQLVDDMKCWIRQLPLLKSKKGFYHTHDCVSKQLAFVKQQQNDLLHKMEEEYQIVNIKVEDIAKDYSTDISDCRDDVGIEEGIPLLLKKLTCPYQELKLSVLNEFVITDQRYLSQLDELKENYSEYINNPHGSWTSDEWLQMVSIIEQYPVGMHNRRALYIDRLLREFHHRSRAEIVSQEEIYSSLEYYQERKALLLKSWQHEKQELAVRVEATFADAWEQHENHKKLRSERLLQQQLCSRLFEKVVAWQQAKQEIFDLETVINAQIRDKEMIKKQESDHKKNQLRQYQKRMIELYHHEQQKVREDKLRQEQKRLQELKDMLLLQAEQDKERIKQRDEKHKKKIDEKRILQAKLIEEEQQRERRLDKLRSKVRVNVAVDPCRVLRETQAYHAKLASQDETELELQTPLFQSYGFTTEKIEASRRFKLTEAIVKAGLQYSQYAQTILASVPPTKPPRPDQASSLFKE